jgi:hypothetical protein
MANSLVVAPSEKLYMIHVCSLLDRNGATSCTSLYHYMHLSARRIQHWFHNFHADTCEVVALDVP